MQAYTVYNRKGGQGKSTLTRDLAAAHAEQGDRVLIVDLDAQKESVSSLYDIDHDKNDPNVETIATHILDRAEKPLTDLIHNVSDGVDLLPRHEQINDLAEVLEVAESIEEKTPGENEFNEYAAMTNVFRDGGLYDAYDVMICDPNAKADIAYYSALYATRNVLVSAKTTSSGVGSIDDVYDTAGNFAEAMDIDIGLLGVVGTICSTGKGGHKRKALELRDEHDAITYFKNLSVYEDATENKLDMFQQIEGQSRVRPSQQDILPKYRTVLAHVKAQMGEPLPAEATESCEFWTGDDFWGDVEVPFAEDTSIEVSA